ncbi:MAG TPA: SIS domain-containing protein [Nitrososphaerales archaeon]|nr:SIS domain-containing protein [Nitrososphaerales archaeon]
MTDSFSISRVKRVDKEGVYEAYRDWPRLAQQGLKVEFDPPKKKFWRVVVMGMGGSASGGDILTGWIRARGTGEMSVCKGHIPFHEMSDTLAIVYSASGQTRETLEMLKTAVERNATVVSISSGGKILELSESLGVPHVTMPRVLAPRYVLPFVLFSCFAITNKALELNCEAEATAAIKEMNTLSETIDVESRSGSNDAKRLAGLLLRRVPAIYGTTVTRGAAIRFKNALNENAKEHALVDVIPELFHNEVESWEFPSHGFVPIFLRHSHEEDTMRKRVDSMVELLRRMRRRPVEFRGRGPNSLAELVTMVYELDLVSYYIAVALGRDPLPTKLLDALKNS